MQHGEPHIGYQTNMIVVLHRSYANRVLEQVVPKQPFGVVDA